VRRVVTGGDLSQREMRPPELVDAYVALVEQDARDLGLLDPAGALERPCPACGGAGAEAFRRLGFAYRRCERCASLFVSPLPDPARLARYAHEGRAEAFWRLEVLPATAGVRARHALGPRVHWVAGSAAARLGIGLTAAVVGEGKTVLCEALAASPVFRYCAVVADTGAAAPADVVVAFETLERVPELASALARCCVLARPGGLLFVSTTSGTGFEVRLLGGRMRSLVPPVHLQLLSREGWAAVLRRAGFRLEEYSTPGGLDVQAVAEACRRDPTLALPPVVDELVRQDDEDVAHAFQELLQQAGMSAHVQFVAVATRRE
jgi:hypothetical protein